MIERIQIPHQQYKLVYGASSIVQKLNNNFHYYSGSLIYDFEADEIIPPFNPVLVSMGKIYLGNINSSYDIESLKEKNITHIVSCIDSYEAPFPDDFNYLIIDCHDNIYNNISIAFEQTNKFIRNAVTDNKSVLIHCFGGRSRSAAVLIAYLMYYYQMTPFEALTLLQEKRPIVQPNKKFMEQLFQFHDSISNI